MDTDGGGGRIAGLMDLWINGLLEQARAQTLRGKKVKPKELKVFGISRTTDTFADCLIVLPWNMGW